MKSAWLFCTLKVFVLMQIGKMVLQDKEIYTPKFKVFEFDHFKQQAGLHTFVLSVREWLEKTNAIGLFVKKGRYAEEADLLNVALFGFTAKMWRDSNPELAKNSNVRDYATIHELTVLANLETHNAQMIREGKSKEERFVILKDIASYQMNILSAAERIIRLEEK